MWSWLYRLCLVGLIVSIAAGCEDDKKSGGSPAPKNELTLKGFQIRRPYIDPDNGDARVRTFADAPFETLNSYRTTDQIWANEIPEGLELTIETTAACFNTTAGRENTLIPNRTTTLDFDRPISLMEVMPEGALFRPNNKSSDSLYCDFRIKVKDKNGNIVHLEKGKDEEAGKPFEVPGQKAYLEIQDGNLRPLAWSVETPPSFFVNELPESARLFTAVGNGADDILFDEVELNCETFTLRHRYSNADYQAHLLDLDYRRARMKRDFLASTPDTFAKQDCRFFSFRNGVMNGFSDYFVLKSEAKLPTVNFDYSGPEAYGRGLGRSTQGWRQTEFATLEIINEQPTDVAFRVRDSGHFGRGQFVSSQGVGLARVPEDFRVFSESYTTGSFSLQNILLRSVNYYVYPRRASRLSDGAELLSRDGEFATYQLEPGASVTYTYAFDPDNCHFSRARMQYSIGHGGISPGSYNTYGVILDMMSPEVQVFGRANKSQSLGVNNLEEIKVLAPRRASSGRYKLVYSSVDNANNWRERLALPADQIRISNESSDGQRHQVCEPGLSHFFLEQK